MRIKRKNGNVLKSEFSLTLNPPIAILLQMTLPGKQDLRKRRKMAQYMDKPNKNVQKDKLEWEYTFERMKDRQKAMKEARKIIEEGGRNVKVTEETGYYRVEYENEEMEITVNIQIA